MTSTGLFCCRFDWLDGIVFPLIGFCTVQNAAAMCRYGGEHRAPELQREAVYGLTELYRHAIPELMSCLHEKGSQ